MNGPTQGRTELFGIASAVVSIQKLKIVWYVEFSGKQTTSQKSKSYFSKKASSKPQKRYELSLCIAVCPSRLFAGAEVGWKIREVWPHMHDLVSHETQSV